MKKLFSQAIRTGSEGRTKLNKEYFPPTSLSSCCVLGAAMLGAFGETEVKRVQDGFPKSFGAILSDRLQNEFPIMIETCHEVVEKLYDQLIELGSTSLLVKGEQGLGELIVIANDESSMTHEEIAYFVEKAEGNLANSKSSIELPETAY